MGKKAREEFKQKIGELRLMNNKELAAELLETEKSLKEYVRLSRCGAKAKRGSNIHNLRVYRKTIMDLLAWRNLIDGGNLAGKKRMS